jgi:hypothetical protein
MRELVGRALLVTVAVMIAGVAKASAGTVPVLQVSPPNVAFGDVTLGLTAFQTFVVTDAGTRQTGVLHDSISGPEAAEYAIAADTCDGHRLRGGESCAVTVVFIPTVPGVAYAQLNVHSDNPPGGYVAWFSGNGV